MERSAIDLLRQRKAAGDDFIGIEELRAAIGGSREEQDAELLRLARERKILFTPASNRKALTPERRAAALRVGNQDRELVSLGSQAGKA